MCNISWIWNPFNKYPVTNLKHTGDELEMGSTLVPKKMVVRKKDWLRRQILIIVITDFRSSFFLLYFFYAHCF